MRKQWKKFLTLSLVMAMLCGCQTTGTSTEPEDVQDVVSEDEAFEKEVAAYVESLYDFKDENVFNVKNYKDYMPLATVKGLVNNSYAKIIPGDEYDFPQGGCTDGSYMYLAMKDENEIFRVTKVDMATWEIVERSEPVEIGHANGMAYNSRTNQIVIAKCQTDHYNEIVFLDPATLTVTGEKTLAMEISTIAYNATRDQYVASDQDEHFYILDADFNEILYDEGHDIGLSTQSCDCDDNYIYIGNTGVTYDPGFEVVKVYNWEGDYVGIFQIEIMEEHQALMNYDGKYYVTYLLGSGCGIYEVQYDFEWLAE